MLSRTAENYLRSIYEIIEKQGYVRVSDVAKALNVKAPSVGEMLQKLDAVNLIVYRKRSGIKLTEDGKKTAALLNERYKVFFRLFEIAGVPSKIAYKDACVLEHYVSHETTKAMHTLVENLERTQKNRKEID